MISRLFSGAPRKKPPPSMSTVANSCNTYVLPCNTYVLPCNTYVLLTKNGPLTVHSNANIQLRNKNILHMAGTFRGYFGCLPCWSNSQLTLVYRTSKTAGPVFLVFYRAYPALSHSWLVSVAGLRHSALFLTPLPACGATHRMTHNRTTSTIQIPLFGSLLSNYSSVC